MTLSHSHFRKMEIKSIDHPTEVKSDTLPNTDMGNTDKRHPIISTHKQKCANQLFQDKRGPNYIKANDMILLIT